MDLELKKGKRLKGSQGGKEQSQHWFVKHEMSSDKQAWEKLLSDLGM